MIKLMMVIGISGFIVFGLSQLAGLLMTLKGDGQLKAKVVTLMTEVADKGFSGIVLIKRQDKTVYNEGFSYANRKDKIAFTDETVVDIGSISKQFTGAAILRLEMQRLISTDDKVGQYLPALADHLASITLHELLTHTGGLDEVPAGDYDSITLSDFIRRLNRVQVIHPRGEYLYSNAGYSLLAAVIEKVSGRSIDRYMSEVFFKPLGMARTGYVVPDFKKKDVAHGYRQDIDLGQPNKQNWQEDGPYWVLRGNGGILSTAQDMFIWVQALRSEKVLSKAATKKLFGMHVEEEKNSGSYYGYGWATQKFKNGKIMIWHNGGGDAFQADLHYYPDSNIFYFIAANQAREEFWSITDTIDDIVRNDVGRE